MKFAVAGSRALWMLAAVGGLVAWTVPAEGRSTGKTMRGRLAYALDEPSTHLKLRNTQKQMVVRDGVVFRQQLQFYEERGDKPSLGVVLREHPDGHPGESKIVYRVRLSPKKYGRGVIESPIEVLDGYLSPSMLQRLRRELMRFVTPKLAYGGWKGVQVGPRVPFSDDDPLFRVDPPISSILPVNAALPVPIRKPAVTAIVAVPELVSRGRKSQPPMLMEVETLASSKQGVRSLAHEEPIPLLAPKPGVTSNRFTGKENSEPRIRLPPNTLENIKSRLDELEPKLYRRRQLWMVHFYVLGSSVEEATAKANQVVDAEAAQIGEKDTAQREKVAWLEDAPLQARDARKLLAKLEGAAAEGKGIVYREDLSEKEKNKLAAYDDALDQLGLEWTVPPRYQPLFEQALAKEEDPRNRALLQFLMQRASLHDTKAAREKVNQTLPEKHQLKEDTTRRLLDTFRVHRRLGMVDDFFARLPVDSGKSARGAETKIYEIERLRFLIADKKGIPLESLTFAGHSGYYYGFKALDGTEYLVTAKRNRKRQQEGVKDQEIDIKTLRIKLPHRGWYTYLSSMQGASPESVNELVSKVGLTPDPGEGAEQAEPLVHVKPLAATQQKQKQKTEKRGGRHFNPDQRAELELIREQMRVLLLYDRGYQPKYIKDQLSFSGGGNHLGFVEHVLRQGTKLLPGTSEKPADKLRILSASQMEQAKRLFDSTDALLRYDEGDGSGEIAERTGVDIEDTVRRFETGTLLSGVGRVYDVATLIRR